LDNLKYLAKIYKIYATFNHLQYPKVKLSETLMSKCPPKKMKISMRVPYGN